MMRLRTKDICFHLVILCLAITTKAFGFGYGPTLDLTTAYRAGDISTKIYHFVPDGVPAGSDSFKINNIQIYQLGFDGRLPIWNEFYIQGKADYGWILGGNLLEKDIAQSGSGIESHTLGNLANGDVIDASISAGFLYPFFDGWRGGFNAGWSYNTQRVKLGTVSTEGILDTTLSGSSYKMYWNGPWVGFETVFSTFCNIEADIGFEYHWPDWHASFRLPGPDIIGGDFSDNRRGSRGNAQVAFVKLDYIVDCAWDVGLQFQYQHWDVIDGIVTPKAGSFAAIGFPANQVERLNEAFWWTFDIQLSIKYTW